MSHSLKSHEKHLLKLIKKGANEDGWCPVSAILSNLVSSLPPELVIFEFLEIGGRAKLTEVGSNVLDWM